MKPFDDYPGKGRKLLGRVTGDNCRRGYGKRFMATTGMHSCAYCGSDLTANYEAWLTMALDHVVPKSVGTGLPADWVEDMANRVLACAACNGFNNRYAPSTAPAGTISLDEFFDLRDAIFEERKGLIAKSHDDERRFFDQRPWEHPDRGRA